MTDQAMMEKSDALAVGMLDGWEQSVGVLAEIKFFKEAGKPVFYLDVKEKQIT